MANKDQETRHGRFAVVRGRFSKAAILKPLKPRPHKKESPGSGETVAEFSRVVDKQWCVRGVFTLGSVLGNKGAARAHNHPKRCCLGDIGDYTTRLCGDCSKPLEGSLLTNQYNGK